MATFKVTTSNDTVNANDGVTSLREALTLANGSAGADKIVFDKALAGSTIEVTGPLVLASDVSINGDTNKDGDADISISGGNVGQLFEVQAGTTAALTSLVLKDGFGGDDASAIDNAGILSISYCSLTGNAASLGANGASAATVVNRGTLNISHSAFAGNLAIGGKGQDSGVSVGQNGGHAAGAILNLTGATVVLDSTLIAGGTAGGGNGGKGANDSVVGFDGGRGGSAALGVLNLGTMSGTAGNDSSGGTAIGGAGGSGGLGAYGNGDPGADGQSGLTNLNIDGGSGAITQVALGTMGADVAAGGDFSGLGGSDTITGNDGSSIHGGAGSDRLTGGVGVTAIGGLGDDVLVCSFVSSSIFSGGAGRDTIDFRQDNFSGEIINLSTASFGFLSSTFTGFENAVGSQGDDIIIGSNGVNSLNGFNGADTINGGLGGDTLTGGLSGDLLEGGGGNDRLVGGGGADQLTGGAGLDVLVLSQKVASADTIGDFVTGKDSLEISAAQFAAGLQAGALAAARFRANTTGQAADANDRFIFNIATGDLFFDNNGTGAGGSRLIATFGGSSTSIAASDFDIV